MKRNYWGLLILAVLGVAFGWQLYTELTNESGILKTVPTYESSEFLQEFNDSMSSEAEKAAMQDEADEAARAATERQARRAKMMRERQSHQRAGSAPLQNWEESGGVQWVHRGDETYVRLSGYVIGFEGEVVALALAKDDAGEVIYAFCEFTDPDDIERLSVRNRVIVTGRVTSITMPYVQMVQCKLNYIDVVETQRMKRAEISRIVPQLLDAQGAGAAYQYSGNDMWVEVSGWVTGYDGGAALLMLRRRFDDKQVLAKCYFPQRRRLANRASVRVRGHVTNVVTTQSHVIEMKWCSVVTAD